MTVLSVNINKIATLRNARGGNTPNVLTAALAVESFGAHGITVHPRPDERHIRKDDVYALKDRLSVEFNIEGYPSPDFLAMVKAVQPAQCTLVPDPPDVITSNAGFLVTQQRDLLEQAMRVLGPTPIRVSVFVDPVTTTRADLKLLRAIGVHRIELYTEAYAKFFGTGEQEAVLARYVRAAEEAHAVGLGINAGHDLNLCNLPTLVQRIPQIIEVSIGHELIADALYMGLETAVGSYLQVLCRPLKA